MVKAEIFEENQNTQLISMSEVIEVKNGYAFKSADMTEENKKGFLPVLKIGNVSKQGEIKDGFKYHKFKPEFENFLIPNNSIIIAMTGATVGKVAISKEQKLLLNQRVGRIEIKNKEKINNKYLFYLLKSEKFYHYCQTNAVGGAQGNISSEEIAKFMIPLPLIETQNKIVTELNVYHKIIQGCKQVIENYKPSIEIDSSWKMLELNDLCSKITKGSTPTTYKHEFKNKGINFIKIQNISKDNLIDKNNLSYIDEDCHNDFKRSQLEEGDILLSIAGTKVGITAVVEKNDLPANTNQAISIIRLKDKSYTKFVLYYLQSQKVQFFLEKEKQGVAQFNLSLEQIKKIKVPHVNIETAKKIITLIEEQKEVIKLNKKLMIEMNEKINLKINNIWLN